MGEHETVAALAAQVAELRVTVTQWGSRLEKEVGGGLVLRLEVKQLREAVQSLAATVAAALDSEELKSPSAPYWADQDRTAEAEQLAGLKAWINDFLRAQYPGYQLPACWADHREALWELGNLHAEWRRIYKAPDNVAVADALWFHERWLPGVLGRLARSIPCDEAGCQLGSGRY